MIMYCSVVLSILKNMNVNGTDYPIYEMENKWKEQMFETSNQMYVYMYIK
jgi:hypothetical protein